MNQPLESGDAGGAIQTDKVRPAPCSVFGAVVWIVAILLCAAGIWVTQALSLGHSHAIGGEHFLLEKGCSPQWGENASCDQVLQTPWASINLPVGRKGPDGKRPVENIPVAWLGMMYFVAVGIWLLFVGQPSHARRFCHLVPLAMVVPGVVGSVGFMYLLVFKLPSFCPLCVATHILNFLLLGCVLLLWPRRPKLEPGVTYIPRPHGMQVAATTFLMGFAAFTVLLAQQLDRAEATSNALQGRVMELHANAGVQRELTIQRLAEAKRVEIPIDPDDPVMGPRTARRTLVVFSDFQCPACKLLHDRIEEFWPTLQRLAAPQGGIRFVYKHYPLYTRCNPHAGTNMHAFSCETAKAVEAARIVGGDDGFWKMGRLLYEQQKRLYEEPYRDLAKQLGLDVEAFEAAMHSPEVAARIARHVEQAHVAGMYGTPGLFLDGVRVDKIGYAGPSVWRAILRMNVWPPTEDALRQAFGLEARTGDAATQPAAEDG
ncbi:MAG: thioredoxin domain-containing protein [Phycisphaerae bacterium]|nr:thioredoxin domain-containing protein [Phycisphaerae bacterium]